MVSCSNFSRSPMTKIVNTNSSILHWRHVIIALLSPRIANVLPLISITVYRKTPSRKLSQRYFLPHITALSSIDTGHYTQKTRFTKKNLESNLDSRINFVVLFYQPYRFGFFGTITLRATLNRLAQRAKAYVLGFSLITRRSWVRILSPLLFIGLMPETCGS